MPLPTVCHAAAQCIGGVEGVGGGATLYAGSFMQCAAAFAHEFKLHWSITHQTPWFERLKLFFAGSVSA